MKRKLKLFAGLLAALGSVSMTVAQEPPKNPPAAKSPQDEAVSREAAALEAEVGKYKDTAPEAAEALYKLTNLYHANGQLFGLVRAGQRFASSQANDPRHADVMLKLLDGLEALTRQKDFTVVARQFLVRYPQAPQCPDVEERLAYTLDRLNEKHRAAEAYRDCWKRQPNANGKRFGERGAQLFAEVNVQTIIEGAELLEDMFDKLPKDEYARHLAVRAFYELRRVSQWAKANQVGAKILASGIAFPVPEELREVHRCMGEQYAYVGQYANAAESYKKARAIRDDQYAHYSQIERLSNASAKAAEMEPVVNEYVAKYPTRDDRWDRLMYLAHAFNRDGDRARALALFKQVTENAPATHSAATNFVQQNGVEPAQWQQSEQLLRSVLGKKPEHDWHLRYSLAFDVLRDRKKSEPEMRAMLREFIQKSPTNDGHAHNVISQLLSTAPNDAEFKADVALILQSRREYAHWGNYRVYLNEWIKAARQNKDLKDRANVAAEELKKANDDPIMALFLQINTGLHDRGDAQARRKLAAPENYPKLNDELARDVLWGLGYYNQHYSPGPERAEAAPTYGRLAQRFPKVWDYRSYWLQTAVDYGQPDVSKEAANFFLQMEPPHNQSDTWWRLITAAERSKDDDLARRSLAYMRAAQQKYGVEHGYASNIGDALMRMKLENEAVAYWTEHSAPGLNNSEAMQCSARLLARLTDPQQRIQFAEQRFTPNTDFHPVYAQWMADEVLKLGDLARYEQIIRASIQRKTLRPWPPYGFEPSQMQAVWNAYRANEKNTPENKTKLTTIIRDMQTDWTSAQAEVLLLDAEPANARKPIDRLLAYQRVTRKLWPDGHRWDQLMVLAQAMVAREDYNAGATLITGLLGNIPNVDEPRKQAARSMIGQCYARLGTVGLTYDEKSPIAPLLQAALYLKLGDDRLALESYLANKALFDQHRNEVPVDLLLFVAENTLAAGGNDNYDRVEEMLRGWLLKFSEAKQFDETTKAHVQYLLAKNFFAAQRFDVARSEYTTVINRYQGTPYAIEAEFGIGETFMAQKVYDQAEQVFEKLANSRETEVIVRAEFLRGVLAHRRGDNDDARKIFRNVLDRVPNIELANQALYNLAEVYGAEERYMDQLTMLMTVGRLGRQSKRQHAPGTALSIVVQDSDLGISRGNTKIPVLVRTEPGGDEELVYLTSGGAGKGLFRADLDTVLGPAKKGDKVLQLTGKDVIKSDYPEAFKKEFKSVPLSDVEIKIASDAMFEVASGKIVDEEEETFSQRLERENRERLDAQQNQKSSLRPKNQIKPGNPVYMRVKDADRDLGDEVDTVVAKLVAESGDQVQVTLKETGPHTGIFEGAAETGELPAGAIASDTSIDHSALMAIDKDPKSFWLSEPDGAAPKFLTVDMKDLRRISRAKFFTGDLAGKKPVRGELRLSYDGEFWFRAAGYPSLLDAEPVGEFGAMQYRVYNAAAHDWKTWQQVANLVKNGQPVRKGDVNDGLLSVKRPTAGEEDNGLPKNFVAVWFGKFVQPRAGAVRFQIHGQNTAIAVNGKLELEFGAGGRMTDVWFDKGTHDVVFFTTANPNMPEVSALRARADLNRQQVAVSQFLTSDFDLTGFSAAEAAEKPAAQAGTSITLSPDTAKLGKKTEQFGPVKVANNPTVLGYWQNLEDVASWEFDAATAGMYDVVFEYAHAGGNSKFEFAVGDQRVRGTMPNTGAFTTFRTDRIGTVIIDQPGKVTLSLKAIEIHNGGLMDLRNITLVPATGSRVVQSDKAWEFRFPASDVRYAKFVIHEFTGEAVAINHVEVSGDDPSKLFIPTESDVLKLSQNSVLEIAGGDTVKASYTDDVTQVNQGSSRLLSSDLQATYFNGGVYPIGYEFVRYRDGAVGNVRKRVKRIDPGERIIVEITDYDRDITLDRDTLEIEVSVNDGKPVKLTATETLDNSGIFTKEVDTADKPDGEKLVVKRGDRVFLRYVDEQNTFPGHSVPRESIVYVNRPTEAKVRILESRVIPPPPKSTVRPQFIYQNPKEGSELTNVAFEAPLTVEVIDPDAAKDSRSEVTVSLKTSDGAVADVRCVVSGAFTAVPQGDAEDWALEEGRFVGQIVMQLGSKASPNLVPITSDMPRDLIGGGKLTDEEQKSGDQGLVARILNLTGKDRIEAGYADKLRPKEPKGIKVAAQGRLISNGILASVDRDYERPMERLHVGEKLFLMVTDPDQDASDERDTVYVEIKSELGENEKVPLTETLAHSGIFTGSVILKSAEKPKPGNYDPADSAIEVFFGDNVSITYVDKAASTAEGTLELSKQLPVVIGTDGLVQAFSKTFNDEKLAVETKFHIAESYFELFKSHKSLGRTAEEKEDLAAGRRLLREVMEDYPDPKYQPRILYLLGQFAQELNSTDEAVESYETIVKQYPEHSLAPDAQYKLAQAYEVAGNFDEALEAYVTLAATYPKSPLIASVMIRISDHFYKQEDFIVAAEVGKKFLEKFEGHQHAPKMAFRIGQCYYKAKEFRQAGDSFDNFTKKFPDEGLASDALFWSGESFRMAKDTREAFRRYNRCRWDYPSSESAKYARGRLALPEMLSQFEAEANSVEDNN